MDVREFAGETVGPRAAQACRRLVELFPEACLVEAGERIVFVNPEGLRLLGAEVFGQLRGRRIDGFLDGPGRDAVRGVDAGAGASNTRCTLARLDGTRAEVEVAARAFTVEGQRVLVVFAREAGVTGTADRAAREAAERVVQRLEAIQSVTDATLAHLSLDAMLKELLARVRKLLGTDTATILLENEDGTSLTVRATDGLGPEIQSPALVPIGTGVAGTVAARRAAVAVDDVSTSELMVSIVNRAQRSLLGAPLLVEGTPIGVLKVGSIPLRKFTDDEIRLLQVVADRVAPAIDRARLHDAVVEGRRRLEALSRRLLDVQETERRRIARELHDEVGQLLTGLKLRIEAEDGHPRGAEPRELVNEVMARVRDLSMNLMPPMLDDLGLVPALMWLVERYTAQTRIAVKFRHAGLDRRFPGEVELAVFRVAQEALTNVARHTGVAEARLDVWASADGLGVQVEDDGPGFDVEAAASGASLGLPGMRERVRLAGGRFSIDSGFGSGTRLSAVLPLGDAPAEV